jgi:hypothetical protein
MISSMRFIKFIGWTLFTIFAIVGLIFTGVFVAMKLGLTNVRGTIAERNNSLFEKNSKIKNTNIENTDVIISCKIHALAEYTPDTAKSIEVAYEKTDNIELIDKMFENAGLRFLDTPLISSLNNCAQATILDKTTIPQTAYLWADSPEWGVLKSVFIRDQDIIKRAASDAGISPRILLGGIIGEQFRFFSNRRESFKSYFEPLKILATLSSFSYGIAGLKPETVARVDENLKNPNSIFYLGPNMENIITYVEGTDKEKIRFERITDTKNTYYSYLYVGLFMRQVSAQWHASGYEISNLPGILSTLYNLGFNRSIPKSNASTGGAPIAVGDQQYSFGELGEQFYYSGELVREFPYPF